MRGEGEEGLSFYENSKIYIRGECRGGWEEVFVKIKKKTFGGGGGSGGGSGMDVNEELKLLWKSDRTGDSRLTRPMLYRLS